MHHRAPLRRRQKRTPHFSLHPGPSGTVSPRRLRLPFCELPGPRSEGRLVNVAQPAPRARTIGSHAGPRVAHASCCLTQTAGPQARRFHSDVCAPSAACTAAQRSSAVTRRLRLPQSHALMPPARPVDRCRARAPAPLARAGPRPQTSATPPVRTAGPQLRQRPVRPSRPSPRTIARHPNSGQSAPDGARSLPRAPRTATRQP